MDNLQPQPNMPPTIWETNPHLKKLLLVLIFVFLFSGIGLTVFAVWSNQYREQAYEQTQAELQKLKANQSANRPVSEPAVATSTPIEIKGWQTYKNDKYGFELTLTDAWKGYIVTEVSIQNIPVVVFGFPTTDTINWKEGYTKYLHIFIFTKTQWKQVNSSTRSEPNEPEYLDQNDKYVFAYSEGFQDVPKDLEYLLKKDSELQKAITTFKLINLVDTSTWKIYKNDQYGFEFSYPNDWNYEQNKTDNFPVNINFAPSYKLESKFYYFFIDIWKLDNLAIKTLDEYVSHFESIVGQMTDTHVSNIPAKEIEYYSKANPTILNYQLRFIKEGYGYNIGSYDDKVNTSDKNIEITRAIISTFKFTK
jgi:hypothetical protein